MVLKPLTKLELNGRMLVNEVDCPLLELKATIEIVPSLAVLDVISVVHQCTSTCRFKEDREVTIEREEVKMNTLGFYHDSSNKMYCHNVYKV